MTRDVFKRDVHVIDMAVLLGVEGESNASCKVCVHTWRISFPPSRVAHLRKKTGKLEIFWKKYRNLLQSQARRSIELSFLSFSCLFESYT